MRVFIDTINEMGAHVVAETHSPELFAQLLTELKASTIQLTERLYIESAGLKARVSSSQSKSILPPLTCTSSGTTVLLRTSIAGEADGRQAKGAGRDSLVRGA